MVWLRDPPKNVRIQFLVLGGKRVQHHAVHNIEYYTITHLRYFTWTDRILSLSVFTSVIAK